GATGRQAEAERDPGLPLTQIANSDRKLARGARLDLRAVDVHDAAAKARAVAARAGGYTGSEVAGAESATLSVTVPSEKLDAVLGELAELGEVTSRELHVDDVTERIVDVDSRVASQRASVARVRTLLSEAESISEIVAVEGELTARESELESLLARRQALEGMVAMSTVQLSVAKADPAADDDRGGFIGGVRDGWSAFLAVGGAALTALGAALPFLVAVGVPAALVIWFWRRRGRAATPAAPAA
ncbi:MAG: DUF4349 domain-containing protein, partial [Haloechinothrix sp.]